MDVQAPTLAPPTPAQTQQSSPALTISSIPELAQSDQERSSAESAIFTIYSMYGDEEQQPASWSGADKSPKKELAQLALGDSFSNILQQASPYAALGDATYVDLANEESFPADKYLSAHPQRQPQMARPPSSSSSVRLSYARDSSHATASSQGRNTLEIPASSPRASSSGQRPRSAASNRSSPPSNPEASPFPSSARNSRHSESRHSSRPVLGTAHSPEHDSAVILTPPTPSTSKPPAPPPPPPLPDPHTPESFQTPFSSPLKQNKALSDTTTTSLSRSEGEDDDSFLVRSTYAQLEYTGVKGDGYEEGVERTRARARASSASALRMEAANGDPSDKYRELNEKEVHLLASLDRYGFFTTPSHDRLVSLPAAPLQKRLSVVAAGPPSAPSQAQSLNQLPPPGSPPKETDRIAKWNRMLEVRSRDKGGNVEAWGIKQAKAHKLRRRAYKGIPDRWRSAVWGVLMDQFANSGHDELARLGEQYREELGKPSTYDIQIDLDVPRTISGHVMFRTRYGLGQRSLFHVLHSFSLRCETCGYVQGMGPIAATLLCYMEPERVYAALVRLHGAYSMHDIFSPGFPGLLEAIYVQERLMETYMPDVYNAFKKHAISTTSYATKWYITLFANSVPFQTQLRLWDVYLLDGQDVYVAVALAVVWVYRDQITSASANFETVLSLLSSFFVPENDNELLSWIEHMLGNKKLRAQIVDWRQHWRGLVASGRDRDALL